jgi:hypothetical protein
MSDAVAKEDRAAFMVDASPSIKDDTWLAFAVSGAIKITVEGEIVGEGRGVMVTVVMIGVSDGMLDAVLIGVVDFAGIQAAITIPRMTNLRMFRAVRNR